MSSFSGVTFVLFCFVFHLYAFTEDAALRPIVLHSSICMRPDSHVFLPFYPFFLDVAFSQYFCNIIVFSLYGEYVARFPISDGVFLNCDHGLGF